MKTRAIHSALPLAAAVLLAASPARSQDFSGTYAVSGNGTTVTLTLRQAKNGQITGTLRGNTTFQVAGQRQGEGFSAYATNASGRVYMEGRLQGDQLALGMAEVDAAGQPQAQTARMVVMDRVVAGSGRGARSGVAESRPSAREPRTGQAGAGGRGTAATPQDRQLAQLLQRSAWCSFSYSGVAGTSSGSSHTERVVFRGDGSGARQTGGESYYSGSAGSVAGQSSGGEPFRWQVRNGVLLTSADGVNWGQTALRVTQNSNGYPIINADGKEYSMCN